MIIKKITNIKLENIFFGVAAPLYNSSQVHHIGIHYERDIIVFITSASYWNSL